ncbi:hypothetical protein AYK25_01545 [Thermoplasmatales archaeon SM1-50]|nr:MAG: hypothetical protein AYK25_01545 [Thermoplasmatales archaeon SM1-50]
MFFYPKTKNGEFDVLSPTQAETIKVFPVLGFGKVNITFYCKYKIVNLSSDVDFEVKQEWRDQAFFFLAFIS